MLDCSTATTRPPPEMLFHSLSTNCLGYSAMEVDPPAFKAAAASSATSRQQAPPKAFLAPHAASWPLNSAPVPPQQQAPMPPPGIAWMEGGMQRARPRASRRPQSNQAASAPWPRVRALSAARIC